MLENAARAKRSPTRQVQSAGDFPVRFVRQHVYFNDTKAQAAINEMIKPVDTVQTESINKALVASWKLVPL
jgi:hypothetical protein